tara:strand:- start:4495 stop:5649 length:1155 start_codon:yes stop_codon:yes gene_type:complete
MENYNKTATSYYNYFVSNSVFYTWDAEVELRKKIYEWLKSRPSCYINRYITTDSNETTTIKEFFYNEEKNITDILYKADNWNDYLTKVKDITFKRPMFRLENIAATQLNTTRKKIQPMIPISKNTYKFDQCSFENSILQFAKEPNCSIKFYDVLTERQEEITDNTTYKLIQYTYIGNIDISNPENTYKVVKVYVEKRDELFEKEWITENPCGSLKFMKTEIDIPYNLGNPINCHTENVVFDSINKKMSSSNVKIVPSEDLTSSCAEKDNIFDYDDDPIKVMPLTKKRKYMKENNKTTNVEGTIPSPLFIEDYSPDDQLKIAINRSLVMDSDDEDDDITKLFHKLKRTNKGFASYGYYENNKPIAPFGFDINGKPNVGKERKKNK